jgi:uncharacterized protein YbjT (DUF2867 family)
MSEKKIIAIVGATGAQGGGLARAILSDKQSAFTVRALTRNVNSEKAQALKAMGAEVIEADVEDEQSLEKAFTGAYGVFCITFFWEHFSPEKENLHAKNMARAAKKANVKHVIWSSLEDTRQWVKLEDDRMPTLQGKYKVPHFDAKGEANAYFTDLKLPLTILNTSYYWDNMIYFGMGPQRAEDGNLYLTMPMADKKLPGIAAEDIGKCAYGIFKNNSEYIGKTIGISGEHLTGFEMAEMLSKALGQDVHYNAIEPSVFRSFDFPGAEDMGNMFQVKSEFEEQYCAGRDLELSKSLNNDLLSFNDWLKKNKNSIPIQ